MEEGSTPKLHFLMISKPQRHFALEMQALDQFTQTQRNIVVLRKASRSLKSRLKRVLIPNIVQKIHLKDLDTEKHHVGTEVVWSKNRIVDTQKHRQRHRDTDSETQTHRHIHTQTQTHTCTSICKAM